MEKEAKTYFRQIVKETANKYALSYGDVLCHYTSISTALKILESKEIWLGCTSDMNDLKEIRFFIEQLDSALEGRSGIDSTKKELFFKRIYDRIPNEYPYAFCLSRRYDDVAQWERYGDQAKGCCLVFDTRLFVEATNLSTSMFNEVFYTPDVTQHAHYQTIIDYLKTGDLRTFPSEEGLIDNLILCAYFRKHPSFSSEQEVRWSNILRGMIDGATILPCMIENKKRKFMVVPLGRMCKKYDVEFESLFRKLIIGPRAKSDMEGFKWHLSELGLEELSTKTIVSDCPLRE